MRNIRTYGNERIVSLFLMDAKTMQEVRVASPALVGGRLFHCAG